VLGGHGAGTCLPRHGCAAHRPALPASLRATQTGSAAFVPGDQTAAPGISREGTEEARLGAWPRGTVGLRGANSHQLRERKFWLGIREKNEDDQALAQEPTVLGELSRRGQTSSCI